MPKSQSKRNQLHGWPWICASKTRFTSVKTWKPFHKKNIYHRYKYFFPIQKVRQPEHSCPTQTHEQHHALKHLWLKKWSSVQSRPKVIPAWPPHYLTCILNKSTPLTVSLYRYGAKQTGLLWIHSSNVTSTNPPLTKTSSTFLLKFANKSAAPDHIDCMCARQFVCVCLIKRGRLSSRLRSQYRGGTKPCACALSFSASPSYKSSLSGPLAALLHPGTAEANLAKSPSQTHTNKCRQLQSCKRGQSLAFSVKHEMKRMNSKNEKPYKSSVCARLQVRPSLQCIFVWFTSRALQSSVTESSVKAWAIYSHLLFPCSHKHARALTQTHTQHGKCPVREPTVWKICNILLCLNPI